MPEGRKGATRPRNAPRESKNYAFSFLPRCRRGLGASHIPAVRHNKLFPMRVQAVELLLRGPKVQNGNGTRREKTLRKSNGKKPPQCPGQAKGRPTTDGVACGAVEHENNSFLSSPPPPPAAVAAAAAAGKVNGIISHIHVTRPNEPCQMC